MELYKKNIIDLEGLKSTKNILCNNKASIKEAFKFVVDVARFEPAIHCPQIRMV
tara:strand:+ start:562 stop:723 length:162 start_codon:yes stop_codon:yes gene_type:complete